MEVIVHTAFDGRIMLWRHFVRMRRGWKCSRSYLVVFGIYDVELRDLLPQFNTYLRV
jgi:hypothetical protein